MKKPNLLWKKAIVCGPAMFLIPDYFDDLDQVEIQPYYNILQKINPMATRTTIGCPRSCGHCAVPKIEGKFRELKDWPNLPILCDSNLTYTSEGHFEKVMDRLLAKWDWVDFNQGLDHHYLKEHHTDRIGEIKSRAIARLSLDHSREKESWEQAYHQLRYAGVTKKNIRTYVLIGYDSDPADAWDRCDYIERFKIHPYPMWYHALDQLEYNIVTKDQEALGWDDYERRRIMQWFYHHKEAVK